MCAATVNDRDTLISAQTRKISITYPSDFSYEGDLIGRINGRDTTTVLSDLDASDNTVDILENSGTAITVTSSTLFTMAGSGSGGVFIGSGGLIGKNSSGVTKFTLSSTTGLLTVADANIGGTLTAGSIIANTVTIDGSTALTVKNNASTGASHAGVSGSNPHNTPLATISGDLDDISDGSTYFRTTSNEKTGGDRAFNALDSSNEYVKSLTSTKLTVVGSNPTTGWVGDSNGIRMYQSGSLKVDIPVSGDPSFSGEITGGSNIDITGKGIFRGMLLSAGQTASIVANPSQSSGGFGIWAGASSSGFAGVMGNATSLAIGVHGTSDSSSGVGVQATNTSTGDALKITGDITQTSGDTSLQNVTIDNKLSLTSQSVSTTELVTSTFRGSRPDGSGADNVWVLMEFNGQNYWLAGWEAL